MAQEGEAGPRKTPAPPSILTRALSAVAGLLMFAMMAITFIDVIGRYVFNRPVGATFEIIEIMLGLLIFSAFPLVTRNQDHITVSLFEQFFKGRVGWFQHLFVLVFSAGAVAFMSFRLWAEMLAMKADQDVGEYLDFELWPVIGAIAVLGIVAFFILLGLIVNFLRGVESVRATATHGDPL